MHRFVLAVLCLAGALAAPAMAQTPPAAAASSTADARPQDRVTVVIHTAENCPVCKLWRMSPQGLPVARQLPGKWPWVEVVIIERKSLHGSETEALYPPDLQFLYQARRDRYQLSPPVPLFEIVRNRQVIARHGGMEGWTGGVLPALETLQAGRAGAAARPEPVLAR